MHPNLIALAVPVFFIAIAVEILIGRARGTRIYRLGTAIADLQVGIVSQVGDVFLRGVGVAVYASVYRYRVFDLPEAGAATWLIALVGVDFVYYWWHRTSHVVNAMWAVHAVHHQSEDFNLAVALRQPAFEALTIIPFHLLLALVGVSPWIYASSYAINLIYQFWVHTELAGRLGVVEWVLNTPSAHRVHHGIDVLYLDRNYGGILVIWDRLFGTYQREETPPVYGVTHAIASYNPLWANVAPFRDLVRRASKERSLLRKIAVWFVHPAALYEPVAMPTPFTRETRAKYDPRPTRNIVGYVFAHFVLLTAAGGAFMTASETWSLSDLLGPSLFILLSAVALSGWIEVRRWAKSLDLVRQIAAVCLVAFLAIGRISTVATVLSAGALALVFVLIFAIFRPSVASSVTTVS